MAKKIKKVTIELDRERSLYYTLNSLEVIEELTGSTLQELVKDMTMKNLKVLIYAGLIHEDEELTVKAVGNMIGIEDIPMVSEKIGEAFEGLK